MITQESALKSLQDSIMDLQRKKGNISLQEVETETINVACLEIIKNYSTQISSVHDINQIGEHVSANFKFSTIASYFTASAKMLLQGQYSDQYANSANIMIVQNISWAGMWDFLRDYFFRTHGMRIDNVITEPIIFDSNRHVRFQNSQKVSESNDPRKIIANFSNERKDLVVSIEPSLSAKGAKLISTSNGFYIYKGLDADYKFSIKLDRYDEIEHFVLEMPARALEIFYYE